ncbi:MAG: cell division protein FtsZ, partial [Rhodoferax sp.]|nr:cell division protein FtsZ [Rhodoferax sp.]
MSPLQWGLIATGVLVLLAVLVQNYWLVRRNQPRLPDLPTPQTEPVVGLNEPTLDAAAFDDTGFALPVAEKKPSLDALIDTIAGIELDAPLSGEAVLAAMPPTRRVGSKPFMIEGLNAATQRWEFPTAGQRYRQLQAGVQLANRSGALNDIEFSEFVVKSQTF